MLARSVGLIVTSAFVLVLAVVRVVALASQATPSGRDAGMPIAIETSPVPLNPDNPSQSAVGSFTYAGGLVLSSSQTDRLHGLSDLAITGADRITAVGDEGIIVTARLLLDQAGRLTGVADGRLTVLVGKDGLPLQSKQEADSEGLALFPNGDRLVSFERHHRIWLYSAGGGRPREVPMPEVPFPSPNGGMEALAPDPDAGADAYIVGAEQTGRTWNCRLSTTCVAGGQVERPDGSSLVALRRLPGGRTAYLLRRFDGASRIMLRVMRGRTLDGQLELAAPLTVDNIEGVAAVVRGNGVIRFYLVSDDNASRQQRTLLLAFDWRAP